VLSPRKRHLGSRATSSSLAGLSSMRLARLGGHLHQRHTTVLPTIAKSQPSPKRLKYVPLEKESKRLAKYTESTLFQIRGSWEEYGSKVIDGRRVSRRIAARQ
jgi:hypothetical protein